ncbi:flagellin [Sutcliffiella horikoshii]|uniref:flagellin N-terminal helical domain-containing protein n=1 Tax=Sutcliffiella horikoshii TaxID=79883 RepID=UPI001F28CDB1|nr:flagellin [Sutcliffiella horikoshii]MCG1021587.1 flagellin [Sutcliffiella horikoshii]
MRINHNIAALNTHRQLGSATNAQMKSMEKLSSGLRINKAGDDAAGLAISEKMRAQVRGLDQASRNAQDSISMIQTAEGALNETHDILQRMRELAVQAGNDTNTGSDRGEIQKEINQLTSEINRIGNTTEFNGQKLLSATDGAVTGGSPGVPGTPGVDATTFASATDMTPGGGNTASGQVTVNGTFDGAANTTITFEKTDTGWSIDGGANDVVLVGSTFTTNGLTFDVSAAVGDAVEGDSWTVDLTAAVAAVPGTPATGGSSSFSTQIGANENQTMTLEFSDMRASALGLTGSAGDAGYTDGDTVTDGTNNSANEAALDVSNATNAGNAVTAINNAIEAVSAERSKLGANQNRLEHTINNLNTSSENLTAAESRIRDVDMAKEMMEQTKNSILAQASQAMLAQSNQMPQGVLQLLR